MPRDTPQQRAEIYARLIDMVDEGRKFFTCNEVFSLDQEVSKHHTLENQLPELWAVRPNYRELGYLSTGNPDRLPDIRDAWGNDDLKGMKLRRQKYILAREMALTETLLQQH